MKRCLLASLLLFARITPLLAVSVTGSDWLVHFNLPDQSTSTNTVTPDEYCIRDAIIAHLNALQTGNMAMLTAYSFTGTNLATGGCGPVLNAMNSALNRGARVSIALDVQVDTNLVNGNFISLASMTQRATNPLTMAQATNTSTAGITHDKIGLFDYGASNRWVFIGSWNFSQAASSQEWNIALEARNELLYAAYSNELAQLLAGHFHYDATKSHAHDGSKFLLAGAWTNGWCRFSPYTNTSLGANTALTDVTNRIGQAQEEIVFALNDCTRMSIATQLVQACDRGVAVNGVMPDSDTVGSSIAVYSYLTNTLNYATTNRVQFWTAYAKADGSATDNSGLLDVVHSKWMVFDPFGDRPWLIHGSANWSAAALTDTHSGGNDENMVFLPHRDIVRIFYAHFKRITAAFQTRNDFWFGEAGGAPELWLTDTNVYVIEHATAATGTWITANSASNTIGWLTITNNGAATEFLRARRAP